MANHEEHRDGDVVLRDGSTVRICYWESDHDTDVILLYIESFGNPKKFSEIARRVGRKKPIAVVKSGLTPLSNEDASEMIRELKTYHCSRFSRQCPLRRSGFGGWTSARECDG